MKKTLVTALFATILVWGCSKEDDSGSWTEPVIPVTLTGIEAVNIDNAGEFPATTAAPVKKEAYMVGVRWFTDNLPTDDDKFITDPIWNGEYTYNSTARDYEKAIMCLTPFNATIPAGTYVSKFFKEIDRQYLPAGIDEGFVLLVAPEPGVHRFRVEYYLDGELKFSHETTPVELF